MDSQEQSKKCFCARCFLQIPAEDKIDIDGQSFHKLCSTCCICRTIPTSLKMFYGHVFCNECFKTHVLTRFRGENPRIHSNSWWMQWAPGVKPQEAKESTETTENVEEMKGPQKEAEAPKKCICARCLQGVDEGNRVDIGGQSFHSQCAKCYFCHAIPTSNVKIYYGQVFCEECFHRFVLSRNKDNPSEFFKSCFEQWQNNAQFAQNMKEFMGGNKESTPLIFMSQEPQSSFCRCGMGPEWFQSESKKSATPATVSVGEDSLSTWDLSFENRTEVSDLPESCAAVDESANQENLVVAAAEKIEKLTKYLHDRQFANEKSTKKWKNYTESDKTSRTSEEQSFYSWVDLQDPTTCKVRLDCPKCLWQCGPIYVNSDYLHKEVCCGDDYDFE